MIAPWGAGVLALLTTDHRIIPMLAVTAPLAYGQPLTATGTVRLYQWAAPPVVLATLECVPSRWPAVALVAHQCNPWAGRGR